jgi:hypothetical protein
MVSLFRNSRGARLVQIRAETADQLCAATSLGAQERGSSGTAETRIIALISGRNSANP